MDKWFKMHATYADDVAITTIDDAAEVMFVRGLAYVMKSGSGGLIPDQALKSLCRHSDTRAKKAATALTKPAMDGSPGPWERVEGGYRVRSWSRHNDAADELEARRRSDAERQQRSRERKKAESRSASRDQSRDISRDVTDPEEEVEEEAAAAAPVTPPLPPSLTILRAALEARKLVVRWDRLTPTQATEIDALIAEHGDAALVACAVRAFQPDRPAAFAQAWLPGWRDLRPAGDLRVIHPPCDQPGHSGTTKHCAQCASEQKAAR